MKKGRVIVGLSGGVDSSVAAALLKEQGYEVIGVYILGWTGDAEFPCNWQQEEADAKAVAAKLDVPFQTVNLAKEYEKAVVEDFFANYKIGLTPNPDILCNREIKFKALWQAVRQFEPDFLATGHYAKMDCPGTSSAAIVKPADHNKDQTYFLWGIDRSILPRVLFPLGDYQKAQVRALAKRFGLPTAEKKDSQGICFIGPLKVREFLAKTLRPRRGEAVLADGRTIAQHDGAELYTIGQRLGAGSVDWTGDVPPLFVLVKDLKNNRLIVGSDQETYDSNLIAGYFNWLTPSLPAKSFVARAKIRYRQKEVPVTVRQLSGERWAVEFAEPVRAITPGQSVVFYGDDGELLGGGLILEAPRAERLKAKLYAKTPI